MPKSKAIKTLKNAVKLAVELGVGAYPPFVYGKPYQDIPVFAFHGVSAKSFERELRYLKENGYRTLDADEYYAMETGQIAKDPKAVVLTSDDGWGSLWSVGLPLLKQYEMKVIIFLIPGHISATGIGTTLEQDAALAEARDSSDRPLLSWEEIQLMHESGWIDFQSHTLRHTEIFTDNKIIDFMSPSYRNQLTLLDAPEWMQDSDRPVQLGRPIYQSAPRLSKERRFIENEALRTACERFVQERGAETFFEQANWKKELTDFANQQDQEGRFETDEERRESILEELRDSKQRIEANLPGKRVDHLCYPWLMVSDMAIALSHEAGYKTNFCGKVAGRYIGSASEKPLQIGRVGMDFLYTLPGKHRETLWAPLQKKLGRGAGY